MIFETTNVLQQGPLLCAEWIPSGRHRELITALVCGIDLPTGATRQLFLDTGLIHLMVVSGAHLLFLESLLARAPSWLRLPVLGFYCWLTGFGAPVVKAFLHRVCEWRLRPLGWSRLQIEAVAILISLLTMPWWIFSRSLQMSWMCGLALSLPVLIRWRALDQAVKAHLFLFIFAGASFLSIGWNTLVAPAIGVVLFPLSLLLIPFPFLGVAVDVIWDLFLTLLVWGPKSAPAAWFFASRDLFWIPPLVHVFLLIREVRWRRARAFSL